MKIAPADWPRLLQLLDTLLPLDAAARVAALQALDGDDARLRDTLASLIESQAGLANENFLSTLPRLPELPLQAHPAPAAPMRERIGPWRLLRELGRGGMSVVYLAERADGVAMAPVALKLPQSEMFGGAVLVERFAREREILGALDHPGIVGVRDAGSDGDQPWLAMEYVDGQPLTEDVSARKLGTPERLRCFLQVLDAVAHAHALLVIHRDLKPANVLIDRAGRVKLLDFGIAKLLEPDGVSRTSALTQWGARAMTPMYASPEQIAGGPLGTASDIYSLGVLLHELLTGNLPYELTRTTAAAVEEAILRAAVIAPSRAAPSLRRALRGDLDAIVAKAMALRPADRYRSAEAFADDIRRHLESRPIVARPASLGVRLIKQLRRHTWAYASASALVLALGTGLATTLWQAQLARAEAARANAVQRFVLDIFRHNSARQSDPQRARDTTARELLEIGSAQLEQALADSPAARAEVTSALAQMNSDTGLAERAAALYQQGVGLAEKLHGANSLQLADALAAWAAELHHLGHQDERRRALARALAIVRANPDRATVQRAAVYRGLSEMAQGGDLTEAVRWAELAVADAQALGDGASGANADRFSSLYVAATAHHMAKDDVAAELMYLRALAVADRCACIFPSEAIQTRVHLAEVQSQLLKPAAAEASLRAAREDSVRLNGPRHLNTVQTTMRLASIVALHGRPREALPLIEPLRAIVDAPEGADEFSAPQVLNVLANTLNQLGRHDEALVAIQRAIVLRDRSRSGTPFAAGLRETQARALLGAGRVAEAERSAQDAERILRSNRALPGQLRWERLASTYVLIDLARGDSAAALLRTAELPQADAAQVPTSVGAIDSALLRAQVELESGRDAPAVTRLRAVRARLERDDLAAQLPLIDARRNLLCGRWALVHAPGQARAYLERGAALRRVQLGSSPQLDQSQPWLARAAPAGAASAAMDAC